MAIELKQLLVETHSGRESSARALWNAQAPRLLQYARAILGARADAEDVVQSVFCRILRLSRREVERVNDPCAWLAQVARRESINYLRSHRREAARRRAIGGMRLSRSDGHEPASTDPELHAAIERLPRRLRELIVLKHFAGLTFDQIAAATGLNRNTAAARYRSAIGSLQQEMNGGQAVIRSSARTSPVREVRHVG
jgi:RNA polymerase sigma-70 factor (ECF subfamily)